MEDCEELLNKTQEFFDAIHASKDMIMLLKEKVLSAIDLFMASQTGETLISVKTLLDDMQKNGLYDLDAEMNRYRKIFEIMIEESEKGYTLFSDTLSDHKELLERYILCIFALRRIEFDKEKEFTEEGIRLLKDCQISETAIRKICETEILAKRDKIYAVLMERGIL